MPLEMRLFLLLLSVPLIAIADDSSLPSIAVIPVFSQEDGLLTAQELVSVAETALSQSGRFRIVDATGHPGYSGDPSDQTLRLQEMAASLLIDNFMLLDVSSPATSVTHGTGDSMYVGRVSTLDITGRFYSSSGRLLGSVRERKTSPVYHSSASADHRSLAISGIQEVVSRSLLEIFPYEFSFEVGEGPVYELPVGTLGGVSRGMVFSVVAISSGMPSSVDEYRALGSHGIIQITESSASSSSGRLVTGRLARGATVTALETSSPAILSLSYSVLPTEVVPGDGLTGDEAETSRLVSQAEFTGSTGKWGLSLRGALFSGVLPRMASIGVRGEVGARIPLSSPELALRLGVGFESAFLTQNTRADSISSSASTVTIAGVAGADLEWMFSNHFGIHAELMGRVGTAAEGWSVKSWTGYNRDALPGELYYAEIKQAPVSFSVGLVYMVTDP